LIRPQDAAPDEQHSYFTYVIRAVDGLRDKLAQYLYDKGIYTTLRYHPLHLNPIYQSHAKLPICEQLNEEALSLPIHPRLSESNVAKIIEMVKSFGR
jgi:aminotransferase